MGDTWKEVEAGLEMAQKWLPMIFGLFGSLRNRGVPPAQAQKMVEDHLTPGKPNIDNVPD